MLDTIIPAVTCNPPIDWNRIKELYLNDIPHKDISAQTGASIGAIRCKAYREQWRKEADSPLLANPPSPQDIVNEWLLNMSISMLTSSRWWSKHDLDPTNLRESRDLEAARASHIDSGRKLFGLDRAESGSGNAWNKGNVIDVTATNVTQPNVTQPNVTQICNTPVCNTPKT